VGLVGGGVWPFIVASVLLGLGFTFYTGAVEAWLVDALKERGYKESIDVIFARGGIVFGISMLIGTTLGGFLGQVGLWVPYLVRAGLLVPAFILGFVFMKDIGFTPRQFRLSKFKQETFKIGKAAISYGFKNRLVRSIMLVTLFESIFFMYGFYSWSPYFLGLLGRNLVWVSGIIAALVGLSQIIGNTIVGPITKRIKNRSSILIFCVSISASFIIGSALVNNFWITVPLYLLSTASFGLMAPVKQSWLNANIPSEQRASIISLDALFGDAGMTVGNLGLGYLSQFYSISFAWVIGGLTQIASLPALIFGRKQEEPENKRI